VRLLLIDDDPDVWAVVQAAVADHPRVDLVGTAATPEEGLAMTRDTDPQGILLDHRFEPPPDVDATTRWNKHHGLSGLEAVEFLRAAAPRAVIALYTGVSGLRASAEHSGADLYVLKGGDLHGVLDSMADAAMVKTPH
jgi:DNA-binding NarL/FixJ family response regulator